MQPKTIRLLFASFLAVAAAAMTRGDSPSGEGGERRHWSGISLAGQVDRRISPARSPHNPGFDQERVMSVDDDWEPSVAADPSSGWVYQATTRYGTSVGCPACPDPAIVFRASSDGGATYGFERFLPYPAGTPSQNDPELVVAGDGVVYAAWMNGYDPGVMFASSDDHGLSWSNQRAVMGHNLTFSDKPILVVSPDGNDVYIGFNSSDPWVTVSHDGGASFTPPQRTAADGRYWFHEQGAVRGDSAWFATSSFTQSYRGPVKIQLVRTTDGGRSWTNLPIEQVPEPPDCPWSAGCYFGFLGATAGVAVDSAGKLMVVYGAGDAAGSAERLWYRTSDDGGDSWSDRQELSPAPVGTNHLFPSLATGTAPGDFRVAWQDDRNGPARYFNTWLKRTRDGGGSWSGDLRLSDRTEGAPYKSDAGYRFPYGDYLSISVDGSGLTHVAWGEGTSYDGPGGSWFTREGAPVPEQAE